MKANDTKTRNHSSQRKSKTTRPKAKHKIRPVFVKWWTVFGAVIVALTFIAREAFLEPFKDDVETMRHEVEQYTPRGEEFTWRKEIVESREKCDALLSRPDELSLSNFSYVYRCLNVPSDIYAQELVFDKETSAVRELVEHAATYQKSHSVRPEDQESAISTDQKAWDRYYPNAQADERSIFIIFTLGKDTQSEQKNATSKGYLGNLRRMSKVFAWLSTL